MLNRELNYAMNFHEKFRIVSNFLYFNYNHIGDLLKNTFFKLAFSMKKKVIKNDK